MRNARWTALAGLALLLGAAPTATSAPAAPSAGPYRVRMVHRTGASLSPFHIALSGTASDERAMWFAVELIRERGRWVEHSANGFGGYQEFGTSPQPQAYGRPEASVLPRCPTGPACATPVPLRHDAAYLVRPRSTSRFYVVTAHADVRITVDAPGWRVSDVPNPGFRRVLGATGATGVRAASTAVEHFTTASATGGRWGSSALAYVPCERGGTGEAVLRARGATRDGDLPPSPLQCEPNRCYCHEYAFTTSPAHWRLSGDVLGVGSYTARLVVFDFPRP